MEPHWHIDLHQAAALRLPFMFGFFTPADTGQVHTLQDNFFKHELNKKVLFLPLHLFLN